MIAVLQVVDSLKLAGLESVAANYANLLAGRGVRSCLCSTRASGPLASRLTREVTHLDLRRRGIIDPKALKRLVEFIKLEQIDIIHAHGTSLFFSALATCFVRSPKFLWHDHFGRYLTEKRSAGLYRLGVSRAAGIIAVNEPLAQWARESLKMPADRVWFLPNFVPQPPPNSDVPKLPGTPGKRIVCVANLRPEKDHLTLIEAMAQVHKLDPLAGLILVGDHANEIQAAEVKERVRQHNLQEHVFFLGSRNDVGGILRGCDIGVLASASEGMPLALLEYGMAGLPVVATAVGQVPDVLAGGRVGLMVPAGQPAELAAGLLKLLESSQLRQTFGRDFNQRVSAQYSADALTDRLLRIYETVIGAGMVKI
jgi:glycosyltransferase involved in cell wall biosynthesis